MLSPQQLIHIRILQLSFLFALSIFIYQFSHWDGALWIPISVIAIIGPFRPGVAINKAKDRMLGSIAGLLLSLIVWVILRYNYMFLIPISLVMIYCVAFFAITKYRYFILFVSIMLCINFSDMNLFFNDEISFIVNRIICVFTGVLLCQIFEYWIFSRAFTNATRLVDTVFLEKIITNSTELIADYENTQTPVKLKTINELQSKLYTQIVTLEDILMSASSGYAKQTELIALASHYLHKIKKIHEFVNCNAGKWLNLKDIPHNHGKKQDF